MLSFLSSLKPTNKILLIALVVGVISGFGSLLFYQGLQVATAFFMGSLLQYAYPQDGQTVAVIGQWSEPDSLVLLLPILCFGSLLTGILVTRYAPEAGGHGMMRQSGHSMATGGYGNAFRS